MQAEVTKVAWRCADSVHQRLGLALGTPAQVLRLMVRLYCGYFDLFTVSGASFQKAVALISL